MGRNNKDFHEGKTHEVTWDNTRGEPFKLTDETDQKKTGKKIAALPDIWRPANGVKWKAESTLNEDVENATDSYQVEAAHNKHNPRPKGPHADEVDKARKKGPLTITTQYLDSQDDK